LCKRSIDYISESFVADELSVEILSGSLERQARITEKVVQQIGTKRKALRKATEQLEKNIQSKANTNRRKRFRGVL